MVLIIIVLLLCTRGSEPKIVRSRPPRNDTLVATSTTSTASANTENDETSTVAMSLTGHRNADNDHISDNDESMSTNNDIYGVRFYAPPVVMHGTAAAVDAYGRQVHQPNQSQWPHQSTPVAHPHRHHHRAHRPLTWEPATATVVQGGGGGSIQLMNPLQVAAYDDPSTARYPPAKPSPRRPQPVARLIKYTEPAALTYQLPVLTAEAEGGARYENLSPLQFALQHHVIKQPPSAAALHQLYHHHHPRIAHPHHLHHIHALQPALSPSHSQQHRYATYGSAGTQPIRYTQVPFLYNLPAPPTQRQLAPAEYDLVTHFNRLIKQRERDDRASDTVYRTPDVSGGEEEEEETATRPAAKPKKKKKKRKKKTKQPPTTPVPVPAPIEEELDEEDDRQQQEDERAEDEPPPSEEQESQNVLTSEKLPEDIIINEPEDDLENEIDEQSQLSEQLSGGLDFDGSEGERVEFQLHGLGGPESYKFGFDTGKGTNRQFRYEERDNGGNVRGHYGYLDNDGKMQVYNYSSHPELGYHAQKAETLEV